MWWESGLRAATWLRCTRRRSAPAGNPLPSVLTYRPGRPFLPWERAALRAVARAGGQVLIADDPPGTGTSLAASARAVAAAGVLDSQIAFLLSLFGAQEIPEVLRTWSVVVQPWDEWSIHSRLEPQPVRHALASFAGPDTQIREVTPAGKPYAASERAHLRARFIVESMDRRTGEETVEDLVVEGAGLGYLGRQAVAVASAIQDRVPHVYGFADGLIYRDWLPSIPHEAPDGHESVTLAQTVASYVHARRGPCRRHWPRLTAWAVVARSGKWRPRCCPASTGGWPCRPDRLCSSRSCDDFSDMSIRPSWTARPTSGIGCRIRQLPVSYVRWTSISARSGTWTCCATTLFRSGRRGGRPAQLRLPGRIA